MRLIDADKLIDWIDPGHLRHPSELCYSEIDLVNMISNQPTAYDTEKVIKELFNAAQSIYGTNIIRMEDAIEIVKAGGQNDRTRTNNRTP